MRISLLAPHGCGLHLGTIRLIRIFVLGRSYFDDVRCGFSRRRVAANMEISG
jgi:hypothetical protein